MLVFIGMETSGMMRREFHARGHTVISVDLLTSQDGADISWDDVAVGRSGHIVGDVFDALDTLFALGLWPDLAIFHPDCTFLTSSAEWAYKDPDFVRYPGVGYHQRLKDGTLFAEQRRAAREIAKEQFRRISHLKISRKVVENPRGALSTIRKPSQTVQPYQFGDDASKATCLWFLGPNGEDLAPEMRLTPDPAHRVAGRMVFDKNLGKVVERWANQTDHGQNRLPPSEERWKKRSDTYLGIARAIAAKLG